MPAPRFRTVLVVAAVALIAAAAGYWTAHTRSASGDFIDFVLTDLDGRPRRLSDWRGQPIVLNFWATWCAPCREEIPLLIEAQKRYAARGLRVVGVAIDQRADVAAFSARHRINYPVLLADDQTFDILAQYGNRTGALPYTVVFSAGGDVVHRKLGAFHQVDLEQVLASLLSDVNR